MIPRRSNISDGRSSMSARQNLNQQVPSSEEQYKLVPLGYKEIQKVCRLDQTMCRADLNQDFFVTFEVHPFSVGSSRHAFKGRFWKRQEEGRPKQISSCIVKINLVTPSFAALPSQRERESYMSSEADLTIAKHNLAIQAANRFHEQSRGSVTKSVKFLKAHKATITQVPTCNRNVYSVLDKICLPLILMPGIAVTVEPELEGHFKKFLNNNGEEMRVASPPNFPSAFAHWTWIDSQGAFMISDIQGIRLAKGYFLTDPCVNSNNCTRTRHYGTSDMGLDGILSFFHQHTCNDMCRDLKIAAETSEEWSSLMRGVISFFKKGDRALLRRTFAMGWGIDGRSSTVRTIPENLDSVPDAVEEVLCPYCSEPLLNRDISLDAIRDPTTGEFTGRVRHTVLCPRQCYPKSLSGARSLPQDHSPDRSGVAVATPLVIPEGFVETVKGKTSSRTRPPVVQMPLSAQDTVMSGSTESKRSVLRRHPTNLREDFGPEPPTSLGQTNQDHKMDSKNSSPSTVSDGLERAANKGGSTLGAKGASVLTMGTPNLLSKVQERAGTDGATATSSKPYTSISEGHLVASLPSEHAISQSDDSELLYESRTHQAKSGQNPELPESKNDMKLDFVDSAANTDGLLSNKDLNEPEASAVQAIPSMSEELASCESRGDQNVALTGIERTALAETPPNILEQVEDMSLVSRTHGASTKIATFSAPAPPIRSDAHDSATSSYVGVPNIESKLLSIEDQTLAERNEKKAFLNLVAETPEPFAMIQEEQDLEDHESLTATMQDNESNSGSSIMSPSDAAAPFPVKDTIPLVESSTVPTPSEQTPSIISNHGTEIAGKQSASPIAEKLGDSTAQGMPSSPKHDNNEIQGDLRSGVDNYDLPDSDGAKTAVPPDGASQGNMPQHLPTGTSVNNKVPQERFTSNALPEEESGSMQLDEVNSIDDHLTKSETSALLGLVQEPPGNAFPNQVCGIGKVSEPTRRSSEPDSMSQLQAESKVNMNKANSSVPSTNLEDAATKLRTEGESMEAGTRGDAKENSALQSIAQQDINLRKEEVLGPHDDTAGVRRTSEVNAGGIVASPVESDQVPSSSANQDSPSFRSSTVDDGDTKLAQVDELYSSSANPQGVPTQEAEDGESDSSLMNMKRRGSNQVDLGRQQLPRVSESNHDIWEGPAAACQSLAGEGYQHGSDANTETDASLLLTINGDPKAIGVSLAGAYTAQIQHESAQQKDSEQEQTPLGADGEGDGTAPPTPVGDKASLTDADTAQQSCPSSEADLSSTHISNAAGAVEGSEPGMGMSQPHRDLLTSVAPGTERLSMEAEGKKDGAVSLKKAAIEQRVLDETSQPQSEGEDASLTANAQAFEGDKPSTPKIHTQGQVPVDAVADDGAVVSLKTAAIERRLAEENLQRQSRITSVATTSVVNTNNAPDPVGEDLPGACNAQVEECNLPQMGHEHQQIPFDSGSQSTGSANLATLVAEQSVTGAHPWQPSTGRNEVDCPVPDSNVAPEREQLSFSADAPAPEIPMKQTVAMDQEPGTGFAEVSTGYGEPELGLGSQTAASVPVGTARTTLGPRAPTVPKNRKGDAVAGEVIHCVRTHSRDAGTDISGDQAHGTCPVAEETATYTSNCVQEDVSNCCACCRKCDGHCHCHFARGVCTRNQQSNRDRERGERFIRVPLSFPIRPTP